MAAPHTDSTLKAIKAANTLVQILRGAPPSGSYLRVVTFQAAPGGDNAASVGRVYLHARDADGQSLRAPFLIGEATLPATTGTNVAAVAPVTMQLDRQIPPHWAVMVTLGTTVATGYHVSADGEVLDGQQVYPAAYIAGGGL